MTTKLSSPGLTVMIRLWMSPPATMPPGRLLRYFNPSTSRNWSMALTKTTRVLLSLLALCALSSSAFAGKKDDWYKQAQAAANSGNAGEAMRLYCQVAAEDASYKDANLNCNIMKQEAAREEKKNEERFQDCVKAFNSG